MRLLTLLMVALGLSLAACTSPIGEATGGSRDRLGAPSAKPAGDATGSGATGFALGGDAKTLDMGSAYWLASIASLVYEEPATFKTGLAGMGVTPDELVFFQNAKTDTQGVYFTVGGDAVLAFRGTSSLTDFLTDARARLVHTNIGEVHSGFLAALNSVWNDGAPGLTMSDGSAGLGSFLRSHAANGKRLFVTGHSLGAALASLASVYAGFDGCLRAGLDVTKDDVDLSAVNACMQDVISVDAVYTYGSPRVGDVQTGMRAAMSSAAFRFVNAADIVTKVPDVIGGSVYYHPHAGRSEKQFLVYLSHDGAVDVGGRSDEYTTDTWRTKWSDFAGDHGIGGYVAKLRTHLADGQSPPQALTDVNANFERVKAAYLAAPDADFVPATDPTLFHGEVAALVDTYSAMPERIGVFTWTLSTGELFWGITVRIPTNGQPIDQYCYMMTKIFDSSFVPVLTVSGNSDGTNVEYTNPADSATR